MDIVDNQNSPTAQSAMAETRDQSQLKPLAPALAINLNEQLDYLASHNSGISSMKYFYELYRELYGNRAKELLYQKQKGKKIIGVLCNFIPLELIIAADAIPIRLCTGFQEPILLAEEILPRNFCPLIKSLYGFTLMNSPHFDLVDVIVVPTTCDGKKKLAEILAEAKPTWVMEVPHTNETPQARQLWLTEIQLFKKQLEKVTGNKITAKKLRAAIELLNHKRAVTRRLYELRKRTPPPIWGRDAMLVTNLSLFDDTKRWTDRTEALCNELEKQKPVCGISYPRVMITGSPTVFPTWKIPILIEESGGVIVMDDICTGSKELWDPIESANWTKNDMLIAIADKYLMNTCACFTPNLIRQDRVVQFVKDFKADGVVYHVLQACHIYGMEQMRIEKALKKIDIPLLNIETDFSQEDVEQIRTRIEAFLEIISLRKNVPAPVTVPTPAVVGTATGQVGSAQTAAAPAHAHTPAQAVTVQAFDPTPKPAQTQTQTQTPVQVQVSAAPAAPTPSATPTLTPTATATATTSATPTPTATVTTTQTATATAATSPTNTQGTPIAQAKSAREDKNQG